VWGAVCLVDYNPRDREGYIFGYCQNQWVHANATARTPFSIS
jgi:hypothetical protein